MCPTQAPKTIVTLPEEEPRFSPRPPTGSGSDQVNIKVEELTAGDDLYENALNGFNQFSGAKNPDQNSIRPNYDPDYNDDGFKGKTQALVFI